MPTGKLIILNGGSSAGKTSLGRAMQDLLPDCHMLLGIDTFSLALPPAQLNLSHVSAAYYTWRSETGADGREYFVVEPGPILDQAMYARYRAIKAYLDFGLHVIADDVIWKRDWLVDMVRAAHAHAIYDVEIDTRACRRMCWRVSSWTGSRRVRHRLRLRRSERDWSSSAIGRREKSRRRTGGSGRTRCRACSRRSSAS